MPTNRSQGSVVAPGDSENSLTVGAMQAIGIAPYSSRGQLDDTRIGIDIVAPGEVSLRDGSFIGTSAAAPIVAASAALVWEANPDFTARQVRTYLENAAIDDTQFPGRDNTYGYGILDLPLPISSPEEVALVGTPVPINTPLPQATSTIISTDTPLPQATATDSNSLINAMRSQMTDTPLPQATAISSNSLGSAMQSQATNTTLPVSSDGTVTVNVSSANLRNGPGTQYNTSSSASSGTVLDIIARTSDSEWYLIEDPNGYPAWIWSGIVDINTNNSQIEVVATIPTVSTTVPPQVSNSSRSCNPGQWDICGSHDCTSNQSAQCNSQGTSWMCIDNPGTCSVCIPNPPADSNITSSGFCYDQNFYNGLNSYFFQSVPPAPAQYDLNGDGTIDINDYSIMAANYCG
ncbi:MAG: hypothetical protein Phog2KO_30320 [Phototrophicaceae bacterium]